MTHTVLIVDDSEEARDHIKTILSESPEGFRTLTAANGLDAFTLLVSKQIDLVLCDVVMPTLDGLKFLALKSTRPDLVDIPVIMLTVVEEVGQKVKALEGGASDCLTKPCHEAELLARVRVHLNARLYHRELRKKNAELELLSNTDALTGLANRRHLLQLAEVELLRAEQDGTPLSLIMVDIDHFKHINDEYGHLVGDQVLRRFAAVLRGNLTRGEITARYGGEEFALLLPECTLDEAIHIASRYRTRIVEMRHDVAGRALSIRAQAKSNPAGPASAQQVAQPLITWAAEPPALPDNIRITASFGVAAFPAPGVHTLDDLLRCADRALYRAKASGRDCVVAHDAATVDGERRMTTASQRDSG